METIRKTATGSCHCGNTKYVAILTLPKHPDAQFENRTPNTISRIYKCNCTPCRKMSFFHVRLVSAPSEFILLHPSTGDDPLANLGDYKCNKERAHWYFCKQCGVRPFIMIGEGEVAEVDVDEFMGKQPSGKAEKVWRLKKDGYVEGKGGYFSLNASTLDHDQEGLDLRDWHERGWIRYLDEWKDEGGWECSPHPEGMY